MAGVLLISSSLTLSLSSPSTLHHHHHHHHRHSSLILRHATTASFKPQRFPVLPAVRFPRKSRGQTLLTRAGASTSSYFLAFVLPFSLVVITVLTSIRVADKLDRDFLEEVALNQAIREADEDDDDEEDDDDIINFPLEQPAATPRARNRPIRKV